MFAFTQNRVILSENIKVDPFVLFMSSVDIELIIDERSSVTNYFAGKVLFKLLRILFKQIFHFKYLLRVHELIIDVLSLHSDDVQPIWNIKYF